jgi:hypothetical protein
MSVPRQEARTLSTTLAISSLGLRTMGHADAENVTITASFADPLTDISTGKLATPFDISAEAQAKRLSRGQSRDSAR